MQLSGRDLSVEMRGEDVALLQRELELLGFNIPQAEVERQFFGPGTQQAVLVFQRQHAGQGLGITGVVDERTAAAINAAVGALPPRQFLVRGQVRQGGGVPAVGLVVRAFDQDPLRGEVPLGEAMTNADGAYEIPYTSRDFDGQHGERPGPDLVVRVFDSGGGVLATSSTIHHAQPVQTVDLVVERVPLDRPFVVRGRVRHVDGPPFERGVVHAFDRDLRSEQLLGETITDRTGGYEIRYGSDQFSGAEKATADLVVRAYGADRSQVAASPILFNAGPVETVDLVVGGEVFRGPSEYERLFRELEPLRGRLSFAELTEDDKHQDVSFLSGETGQEPEHIVFLITAHRVTQTVGEPPAEVFYGLFREGLPTDLTSLLAQSPDVQRRALVRAVEQNIISSRFGDEIESILAQLKQRIIPHAFEEPTQPDRATLAQLIGTVLPERDHQAAFVSAYVEHSGPIAGFWDRLQARPEFADRVAELQQTVQFGTLSGNHVPLVRELQRMSQAGEVTALSDLARLGEDDWLRIVERPRGGVVIGSPPDVPGKDDAERIRNYARSLAHIMEDAFPTAFAAGRVASADVPGRDDLLTFFRTNPNFDVRSTRVRSYLVDNPGALENVTDVDATVTQLRTMQRLYRLTPRFTAVRALMKDQLDSAYQIARLGRNVFLSRYGESLGGPAQAQQVYENAHQAHAMATTLAVAYGPTGNHLPMNAVPDAPVLEVDGVPEWSTLFGSLELCGCEHCRSIHGPAAYLVDVLHFLADLANPTGRSPKEVLLTRRPDLGEIELSCENTNTPLPYVDLVNEVLENAVAPPPVFKPFSLAAELETDLASRTLSPALRAAFTPPLSDLAVITIGGRGNQVAEPWWIIDEPAFTYTVRKESGSPLRVVSRSLQTKGLAADLAANPQYVNAQAYDVLRRQVHPWSLPFNLWWAEAGAYLGQLGVPRHQIMDAFLPGDRTDKPESAARELAVACEYLGITVEEARIITGRITSQPGAVSPGPWNLWGFQEPVLDAQNSIPDPSDRTRRIAAGGWLDVISGRVDVFLQQSGLTYREMLGLLETRFVNPVAGGTRTIRVLGPADDPATCETSKLRLDGLDEAAAGRVGCFVRLWRRLGWSMREVDLALLAFGSSEAGQEHIRPVLDDGTLIRLFHVAFLANSLNRPVRRLLAWWVTNLGEQKHRREWWTTTYIDHDADGQPEVASFYAHLFRNRSVVDPPDPAFTEDPAGLTGTLSQHAAAITAALGISAADLDLLIGSPKVVPADTLSLDNLACLYRHAGLAKALRLKIRDYLITLALIDADPFASTTRTLLFAEKVGAVHGSAFSLAELDYLLRHRSDPKSPVAPKDEAIAVVLAEIRAGLQQIAAENTFSKDPADPAGMTTDPDGDLTRMKLALLNWDGASIEQAIATLNGTVVYETLLNTLPDQLVLPNGTGVVEVALNVDITLPAGLSGVVSHEPRLLFTIDARFAAELDRGQLSDDLRQEFTDHAIALSNAAQVETRTPGAYWQIVDAGRSYAIRAVGSLLSVHGRTLKASRFLTPPEQNLLRNTATGTSAAEITTAVEALLREQDGLQGVIAYDEARGVLRFTGPMTQARKTRLDAVPEANQAYRDAVYRLFDAPRQFVTRHLRGFAVRDVSQPLAALPTGVRIPAALKGKAYFDATTRRLHFAGVMTEQERKTLVDASGKGDTDYRYVVEQLYNESGTVSLDEGDTFLTNADAGLFFDQPQSPADRFLRVLGKLLPHLRTSLSEKLVVEKVAEALQLERRSAEALLRTWLISPADPQHSCLAEFLDATFAESNAAITLTAAAFPAQFRTFRRVHNAALLATQFGLTHRQLTWLATYGPAAGWLDLNALPTEAAGLTAAFDGWLGLAELVRLRNALPQGEAALDELLALAAAGAAATPEQRNGAKQAWFQAALRWTQWSASDLTTLVGKADDHIDKGKLNISFPDDYQGVRLLVRLWECFTLLRRTGMSAGLCAALSDPKVFDPDSVLAQATARRVKQAARAQFDEAQWLTLAKPLRDILRKQQRTALVAYLVARLELPLPVLVWPHPILGLNATGPAVKELQQKLNMAGVTPTPGTVTVVPVTSTFGAETQAAVLAFQNARGLAATGTVDPATWVELDKVRRGPRDADDLYAHFLIDVEMDPCMMTSRIKQAISSTQLFVQRCLMSLEPEVIASTEFDEDWPQWRWMKNYRVWEANRKVFLYPENWIEPELRDDKSPFFKQLESDLLQSDLTLETAETAFQRYLENLDQVARLEIVGIHHQLEKNASGQDTVDILHVFGRTYGIPHIYYHRQWVNRGRWTAWERVDLDIEGDHLIPVVWNRRLYLFWPIFTEKAEPLNVTLTGGELKGAEPRKYWEIKLAWSERKQGKWANKKTSSAFAKLFPSAIKSYYFRVFIREGGDLEILVDAPSAPRVFVPPPRVFVPPLPTPRPVVGPPPGVRRAAAFRFNSCNSEPQTVPVSTFKPEAVTGTRFSGMYLREDGENRLCLPAPTDAEALAVTPGTFLLLPHADGGRFTDHPFFYLDDTRTFFVIPLGTQRVRPIGREWLLPKAADPRSVLDLAATHWQQLRPPSLSIVPITNPGDPILIERSFPVPPVRTTFSGISALSLALDSSRILLLPKFRAEYYYLFQTHYHPYVCAFVRQLNREGIDGLLQRQVQTEPWLFLPPPPVGPMPQPLDFEETYQPHLVSHPIVDKRYPTEDVDFEYGGAYSSYNWELFFHAPLMIADRLSKNQRFEEAQKWFHYIFDPTDTSSHPIPQRYWRTKKFYETTREDYQRQRIQDVLKLLAKRGDPAQQEELERQENAVREWRENPFRPHLIARLRTVAYQKTVVMKYIDNLIEWGDQLFRRDTIESINEATQLYILAAEILGRRPEDVPPRAIPRTQTYNSLEPRLDTFSNALVQIEELISPAAAGGVVGRGDEPPLTLPGMLYFCVPRNEKLLGYWDTVADRLFKIRHCMNIEGMVRQLPLFEPPIDPGLLVRAAAEGIDLASVLNDVNTTLPHYRFQVMSQKATEICAELKSLGASLLSTVEKRDAEALALLRAEHETTMLELIEQVKKQQYDEAVENQKALRASRHVAAGRYVHYQKLLGVQSPQVPGEGLPIADQSPSPLAGIMDVAGAKMIPFEAAELASLTASHVFQTLASADDVAASIAHIVPNFNTMFLGLGTTFGGSNVGSAISAFSGFHKAIASQFGFAATMSSKLAQYVMRAHDWMLQSNLAAREIMQIDKQIAAAEIRRQIAEKELENHRRQIGNAKEVEDFLRDKYTNQELYGWMLGQVAGVYFQTYQLAYDVAKRAERAYRHELGLQDSSFIRFGYWDSLKKGLLAGEKLYHDLKRMEVAYLDQNKREYEITKHVSVNQLDPLAMLQLKQSGECFFSLPEALFDLDHPGHYLRRLKSVSITIPCVTGPYTSVNSTLTLLKSSIRHTNTANGQFSRDIENDDPRFTDSNGAIQSIVTSGAQNDSGLFETNLRDDRYLPFEGAGAISEWRIELPRDFRSFDYDTISDIVLHLRYTARDGGGLLEQLAATELRTAIDEFLRTEGQGLARPVSLRHEFPAEWHRFLNPSSDTTRQTLTLALTQDRFPFLFQAKTITINSIDLFVKIKPEFRDTHNETDLKLSLQPGRTASDPALAERLTTWNGLLRTTAAEGQLGDWTLAARLGTGTDPRRLDPAAVEDITLVCNYTCT